MPKLKKFFSLIHLLNELNTLTLEDDTERSYLEIDNLH